VETPLLGLRTVVYRVPDLSAAKMWYTQAFQIEPYFDQPFYVGFNIKPLCGCSFAYFASIDTATFIRESGYDNPLLFHFSQGSVAIPVAYYYPVFIWWQ